jgi:hypothetical protein
VQSGDDLVVDTAVNLGEFAPMRIVREYFEFSDCGVYPSDIRSVREERRRLPSSMPHSGYTVILAVIKAGFPQCQQCTSPGDVSGSLPWMSHRRQMYAA